MAAVEHRAYAFSSSGRAAAAAETAAALVARVQPVVGLTRTSHRSHCFVRVLLFPGISYS